MQTIGNYIYDAKRLIFYRSDYSEATINRIETTIKPNDDYVKLKSYLDSFDANNMKFHVHGLNEAGICLTRNCNLKCNYCIDSSGNGYQNELSVEDIMIFIKEMLKLRALHKLVNKDAAPFKLYFSGGGEPTFNWDLFKRTILQVEEYCKSVDIPLSLGMTTNGLLSHEHRLFVSDHFSTIMVSYDGMPNVQNKNRPTITGCETNDIVAETIAYFSQIDKIELTIRTTVWPDDFVKLNEMADYLLGTFNGNFEWSIRPIIPVGRAANTLNKTQGDLKHYDFLPYYLDVLKHSANKYNYKKISNPIYPIELNYYSCGSLSTTCSNYWLLPNKKIVTCIESFCTNTEVGIIKQNGIEYYDSFEDPLLHMCQRKFVECRDCIAYRFCRGGCPARHYDIEKMPTQLCEWECIMIKKFWHYVFAEILNGSTCFGWKVIPYGGDLIDLDVLVLKKQEDEENEN